MTDIAKEPAAAAKQRSSNLELYRIFCMLLIIAHHFVVNSGLLAAGGPMKSDPLSANSIFLDLFGMWGKTGINCFLMITGYYMCTSRISLRKFLKLYLWVIFYVVIGTCVFLISGREKFYPSMLIRLFPFTEIRSDSFTSAFLVWWLFIPFLNVLVNNIGKKMHLLLIALLVMVFTVYPTIPRLFRIDVNPICWFSTIYIIASYIRKYPQNIYKSDFAGFWGIISITLMIISMMSVIAILILEQRFGRDLAEYFFVGDSNMPLALLVSVSTFLWFKNMKVPQSKFINILGGSSFGVLLFHAGSDAMRQWLWVDTLDCVGHYSLPLGLLAGYCCLCVAGIYLAGVVIDRIRIKFAEEPFFRWFDSIMQ